jgi:hypothetical protein
MTYWWIIPMVFFWMMALNIFFFFRRGDRGWCFPFRRRSDERERMEKLEEDVRILKDRLN